MDLEALRLFSTVAELASFTKAADQLGLTRARVSTSVQRLEAQLGTRLFQRTTRTVRLTADGELLRERAASLLGEADELQTLFQQAPDALRGKLRLDLPTRIARHVVIPQLPGFLALHPHLEIAISSTDRLVDLVHEGFDCVLRVGALSDSGLVAKRLGVLPMINCASPAYLAAHGSPERLEDLARHRLVHFTGALSGTPSGWEYHDGEARDGDRTRYLAMPGVITVSTVDDYEAACLAGLGLIQAPEVGVRSLVERGLLVRVMPGFEAAPMPVSLLQAHRRHVPKRVQALMAWLGEVMAPYLDGRSSSISRFAA